MNIGRSNKKTQVNVKKYTFTQKDKNHEKTPLKMPKYMHINSDNLRVVLKCKNCVKYPELPLT